MGFAASAAQTSAVGSEQLTEPDETKCTTRYGSARSQQIAGHPQLMCPETAAAPNPPEPGFREEGLRRLPEG